MRKGPPPPIYQIKGRARVLIGEGHCIPGDSSPTTTGKLVLIVHHMILLLLSSTLLLVLLLAGLLGGLSLLRLADQDTIRILTWGAYS